MAGEYPVKSAKVRNVLIIAIVSLLLVTSLAYYSGIGPFRNNSESTTSGNSQTSLVTTFITHFHYDIVINYSGSWNLEYWGQNGTLSGSGHTMPGRPLMQYNIMGRLNGSGDYRTTITTYGVGYVENTLCAEATKLDSRNGLTLTLVVVEQGNSTTSTDPSAEMCATFAV